MPQKYILLKQNISKNTFFHTFSHFSHLMTNIEENNILYLHTNSIHINKIAKSIHFLQPASHPTPDRNIARITQAQKTPFKKSITMDYELPTSDNDLWVKYDNLIFADLLTQCRYYHGEALCPSCFVFSINENFWNYEKRWGEANINHETQFLKHLLIEYIVGGLAPFNTNDGTPSTLKALSTVSFNSPPPMSVTPTPNPSQTGTETPISATDSGLKISLYFNLSTDHPILNKSPTQRQQKIKCRSTFHQARTIGAKTLATSMAW